MYSNKENVNILTSLLSTFGVRHAVVCPGSRNAAIVHNLNECPEITCIPVTDERSAGFYALGMALGENLPVIVCVTSGTALLNLIPAVAEAYYQCAPLIVISADRPPQWIDQLDGQTLPQPDALGRFVRKAVTLPEPHNEEEHWYCNRLVNEALLETLHHGGGPVHINVPITEPLFEFTVKKLPEEREIDCTANELSEDEAAAVTLHFLQAERPLLLSGQPLNALMDEAVYLVADDESYTPDFVLNMGGSVVSKRLKQYLRRAKESWLVNEAGTMADPFMNLTYVIEGCRSDVEDYLTTVLEVRKIDFVEKWKDLLDRIRDHVNAYQPDYSQMAAVKLFEKKIGQAEDMYVHYANSTAIRLANTYAEHEVFCNRGVNGIDGSLSTAAGFSCVTDKKVFCVIGDLSFFYDQNALWNQNLRGNLRILLLNNGRGGIFNTLKGLEKSEARDTLVAAKHHTTAEGICAQNKVDYMKVKSMRDLKKGIEKLVDSKSRRPMLLEVFTDVDEDTRVVKDYYESLKQVKI